MMDEQFQKVIMEWKIAMSEEQCRHAKETRRINEELECALVALTSKKVYPIELRGGVTGVRVVPLTT